jgi:5-formaminoimidazole-4-carboxamide-1-(beta)-D-ribofuranosyl 5'-monophosphate synthetase
MKIGTIGSHSALQILRGARDEGLKNLLICDKKRKDIYDRFSLVDEYLLVDDFKDVLSEGNQQRLIDEDVIIIPHGSFVEYVGAEAFKSFRPKVFGNKDALQWESDKKLSRRWFEEAGIKTPREFSSPSEIDSLAIVKFGGAKGGSGYKLVKDASDFEREIGEKEEGTIIQEYILGTRFYPHFFYSKLTGENELMGIDIRYESNADALSRLPPGFRTDPSYVVTGNLPVVLRESLLPKIFDIADRLVEESKKLFSPGIWGPYCIEMCCTPNLDFYVFEVSARIVAGTNIWVPGSPYSYLKYGKDISTGRRIAMELKKAWKEGRLEEIVR